jgi:septum formation protein
VRLILASTSPRRAELLRAAGYTFEIRPANVDEGVQPSELPRAYVQRLASEKSAAAFANACAETSRDDLVVLGADTTVIVGDEILGKPTDNDDAARMLRRLSGRVHRVLTGLSVRRDNGEMCAVEETTVEFRSLTDGEIEWYVASGEGRDKAGAYAIQGLASRFIPRIGGSYSNVVGLPVARLHELLLQIASGDGSGYSQH